MLPYTTMSVSKARASHPHTAGLRTHFLLPKREHKLKGQKKKLQSYYHSEEHRKLQERLAYLQGNSAPHPPPLSELMVVDTPENAGPNAEPDSEDWVDNSSEIHEISEGQEYRTFLDATMEDLAHPDPPSVPTKWLIPNEAGKELYQ